jgi:hypothetical protein
MFTLSDQNRPPRNRSGGRDNDHSAVENVGIRAVMQHEPRGKEAVGRAITK